MNTQYSEAFLVPNPTTPCQAVVFDVGLCLGCNTCVDVCRSSVLCFRALLVSDLHSLGLLLRANLRVHQCDGFWRPDGRGDGAWPGQRDLLHGCGSLLPQATGSQANVAGGDGRLGAAVCDFWFSSLGSCDARSRHCAARDLL